MPLYLATFRRPVHGNVAANLEDLAGRVTMEDPPDVSKPAGTDGNSLPEAKIDLSHWVRIL